MDNHQIYNDNYPPQNIMDARKKVVHHSKNGHFDLATQAFGRLCEMIKFTPCHSGDQVPSSPVKVNYSDAQIENFQKSISSLVRYAPTIQDSLDYACFCLNDVPEPLRDEALEIALTINLLYLYRKSITSDGMKKALELIKTGVAYGYAHPKSFVPRHYQRKSFQDSHLVFTQIAAPVLRHFGLALSDDKNSIVPVK